MPKPLSKALPTASDVRWRLAARPAELIRQTFRRCICFGAMLTEQIASNIKALRQLAGKQRPRARSGLRHALADRLPRERGRMLGEAADALVRNVTARAHRLQLRTYYAQSIANQRARTGPYHGRSDCTRTSGPALPKHGREPRICIVGNPEQCADDVYAAGTLEHRLPHSFCLSGYLHDVREADRFHRLRSADPPRYRNRGTLLAAA